MRKTAREMADICRDEEGAEIVSVPEVARRLAALGYKMDRSLDCRDNAQILTGSHAGTSYPCCSAYVVEIDTGLSFAHVDARRDANFRALQEMRGRLFAISGSCLLEL